MALKNVKLRIHCLWLTRLSRAEWIKQGSIQVNGDKVTDLEAVLTPENALLANLTLIKKGKRNYYLLEHK